MVQTVTTMISLMAAIGAMLIIAASLAAEWHSVRRALASYQPAMLPKLPARTRQIAAPRRARMVRITPVEITLDVPRPRAVA